jgi:hypothetical protein
VRNPQDLDSWRSSHLTWRDWSGTPQALRDKLEKLPPSGPELIEQSLSTLAEAVGATGRV